jgi:hypothetical protein
MFISAKRVSSALLITLVACGASTQELGSNDDDLARGGTGSSGAASPGDGALGSTGPDGKKDGGGATSTGPDGGSGDAATPAADDPFEVDWTKPILTNAELDAYLAARSSEDGTLLGTYPLSARTRSCSASGCTPWQVWTTPKLWLEAWNPPSDPPSSVQIGSTINIYALGGSQSPSFVLGSPLVDVPVLEQGSTVVRSYVYVNPLFASDGSLWSLTRANTITDPFTAHKLAHTSWAGHTPLLYFPPKSVPQLPNWLDNQTKTIFEGRVYKDGTFHAVATAPTNDYQLAIFAKLPGF